MKPARLDLWCMLALSFGTGVLDAATYLGMEHVFGANMTGNVILVGMALLGSANVPLVGPLLALAGFALGAACAGFLADRSPRSRLANPGFLLSVVAVGLLASTTLAAAWPRDQLHEVFWLLTLLIGSMMGVQSVAARAVGVPDVTTVVVTSTMSQLFAGLRGPWRSTMRRIGALSSMFLGAVLGTMLIHAGLSVALLPTAAIATVVAPIYVFRRQTGRRTAEAPAPMLASR